MSTYTYTAADGETVTGTLEQIGAQIVDWYGDRATQDNPEPWITLDDSGTESARSFTLDEAVRWIARAEDRPIAHAKRALVATAPPARMTADEFRAARDQLGFSGPRLAEDLGVRADTLRRWESGRDPIPYAVPGELRDLCEKQAQALQALAVELVPDSEVGFTVTTW